MTAATTIVRQPALASSPQPPGIATPQRISVKSRIFKAVPAYVGATDATSADAGPKPSAHRFGLLRYGPDRGELIGGQRLVGKQQAAAFIEVGAPCAEDGSRLLEGLRDDVAHRHVDLALGRLGGFDATSLSPQERLRRG